MTLNRNLIFLIVLLFILTISCKGDIDQPSDLRSIEVSPENLELEIGEGQYIKANPVPTDVNSKELPLLWESDNKAVVTVTESGLAKGISAGSAKITVMGKITKGINRIIPVTVVDNSIVLTGITVTPEEPSLEIGKSLLLTAKAEPANATGVMFVWDSKDKNIVTVTDKGLVTAKAAGKTTVTVKSGNIEKNIPVMVNTPPFKVMIAGRSYSVDTLNYEVLGKGVHWFKFSIPEFTNGFGTLGKGLIVNAVEVDLTFPENRVEVWPASQATWGNVERPSAAFKRIEKKLAPSGQKPVAAINGDFFLLSASNNTGYAYINNRPTGMEVTNGMVVQTPLAQDALGAFIIRDNGQPEYANTVSFSGKIEAGDKSFNIKEVNSYAAPGELVLFNNLANSYPTDSAFAWSPQTSIMVSLSHPTGGWRVNDRMEFVVTGIDYDVSTTIPAATPYKGKDFNGQGAILVGNPSSPAANNGSQQFLSGLKTGDKVSITMEVFINNSKVSDKKLNIIGFRGDMLRNGMVSETWNEAHPRTAIGYSQNKKIVYMVVVDGRQNNFSAGATTGQVGYILKSLGASTGVNLDGGGSSAMVINGNVTNKPSDGPGNERAVANGVMVITK